MLRERLYGPNNLPGSGQPSTLERGKWCFKSIVCFPPTLQSVCVCVEGGGGRREKHKNTETAGVGGGGGGGGGRQTDRDIDRPRGDNFLQS